MDGVENVARPFSVSNTHPNQFPGCADDSFDIMNVVSAAQIRAMLGFKSGAAVSNLLQGYSGKRKNNVHMRIETNKKPAQSKWLLKMMGNISSVCFADPDPLETLPTFTVA